MKGRGARRKGADAEREFRDLLIGYGFQARRDGRLDSDLVHNVPGVYFEVKRRETLAIPKWIRQAEDESGALEPVVAYRTSRQPWRVVVSADEYLRLKKLEAEQ